MADVIMDVKDIKRTDNQSSLNGQMRNGQYDSDEDEDYSSDDCDENQGSEQDMEVNDEEEEEADRWEEGSHSS